LDLLTKIKVEINWIIHFVIFFAIIGYFSTNKKIQREREREKERKDHVKFNEPKKDRCTKTE
jgi:hypothetical protein